MIEETQEVSNDVGQLNEEAMSQLLKRPLTSLEKESLNASFSKIVQPQDTPNKIE